MSSIHPAEPPRLELAQLPTPLVNLKNLAAREGLPALLMKRDDLTGLELSGNKIRKLEYLLADATIKGADTVVTHGGYQSNHCRATAAAAARLGMGCRLILRSPAGAVAPENEGNLFLDRLFGARITLHSPEEYANDKKRLIDSAMEKERRAGRRPYFFPVGASVPLGSWGYVRMMHELAQQIDPGRRVNVYAAVSSSGTLAGMVLGKALLGLDNWTVTGIPVSDSVEFFQKDIRALIDATVAAFGLAVGAADTPVNLMGGSIGEGYAVPTAEGLATLELLAKSEGILLDPTYTAKAFAGFLAHLRRRPTRGEESPVFVHTGGGVRADGAAESVPGGVNGRKKKGPARIAVTRRTLQLGSFCREARSLPACVLCGTDPSYSNVCASRREVIPTR